MDANNPKMKEYIAAVEKLANLRKEVARLESDNPWDRMIAEDKKQQAHAIVLLNAMAAKAREESARWKKEWDKPLPLP